MEETLFDNFGCPIAYIAFDEDLTIYMWDGTPVCYLTGDMIYGFNGRHLGWFDGTHLYDLNGSVLGCKKHGSEMCVSYEPYKSYKQYKPYRAYREYAHSRPDFTSAISNEELDSFLKKGIL